MYDNEAQLFEFPEALLCDGRYGYFLELHCIPCPNIGKKLN